MPPVHVYSDSIFKRKRPLLTKARIKKFAAAFFDSWWKDSKVSVITLMTDFAYEMLKEEKKLEDK